MYAAGRGVGEGAPHQAPLRVYALRYRDSMEQDRYEAGLRREQRVFEELIRAKGAMVLPDLAQVGCCKPSNPNPGPSRVKDRHEAGLRREQRMVEELIRAKGAMVLPDLAQVGCPMKHLLIPKSWGAMVLPDLAQVGSPEDFPSRPLVLRRHGAVPCLRRLVCSKASTVHVFSAQSQPVHQACAARQGLSRRDHASSSFGFMALRHVNFPRHVAQPP